MIDSADVVVIGSGAFGASVAYHLARRGARVAVLERAGLASQTSPRAAGLEPGPGDPRPHQAGPARGEQARRVLGGDRSAAALHPERRAQDRADRPRRRAAHARGPPRGRGRRPHRARHGVRGPPAAPDSRRAWHRGRHVEPDRLQRRAVRAPHRLLPRCRKLGAVLLPHTPATEFAIGPRGVEGVRTPRGTIATRVVVDAAGGGPGSWPRASAGPCP